MTHIRQFPWSAAFHLASQGDGDGFEWDPTGVIFGHDYTTNRRFDGTTITSDFSVDLGGAYEVGEVSALGMAVFNFENTNRPAAIGDLLALFQTKDFALVYFWRQSQIPANVQFMELLAAEDGYTGDFFFDSVRTWASNQNGSYPSLGLVRAFSDNVLALSFNADGILASLNGATAQLSEMTGYPETIEQVNIASSGAGDQELEGWVKALIFYEATDVAATIEAYSANAAPENTVAPAITGTAQVGQTLSVSTGTWTGTPTSYEYQWYRGNFNGSSAIAGATGNTRLLAAEDQGVFMHCVVYAVNAEGIGGIGVLDDESVIAA